MSDSRTGAGRDERKKGSRRKKEAPSRAENQVERPIPPLGEIKGTITSLTDKHYGFVTADEWGGHLAGTGPNAGKTPPRYFFHSKGLERGLTFAELLLGDRVEGEAVVDVAPGGRVKGAMLVRVRRTL